MEEERAIRRAWYEEYMEAKATVKEAMRMEREQKRKGNLRKSYRELQAEYMARKRKRANSTTTLPVSLQLKD
eukprot:752071-Hanusia_phi.AAC.1